MRQYADNGRRITVCVTLRAFEGGLPNALPTFLVNPDSDEIREPTDEGVLNYLYRLLNHVCEGDAERMPTGGQHRSLSVGDTVELDGRTYLCDNVGWTKLPYSGCQFATNLNLEKPCEPCCY